MHKHPYRFRGSIAPGPGVKRPVRAEVVKGGTGKLHLDDVIDSWGGDWGISAREVGVALAELGEVNEIEVHLNSPGGEVFEGIAILNALRRHPARTTGVVDGLAASAASFIACGLDEVKMGKNSQLMIHDAWGIAMGPAADMHAMGERLDKLSDNIADIYSGRTGRPVAEWREAMLAETWYSDAEAVAAGLADSVEGEAEDPDTIENAFDLTVFRHPGRSKAPAPAARADSGLAPILTPPVIDNSADEAERERRQRQMVNRARLAGKRLIRAN